MKTITPEFLETLRTLIAKTKDGNVHWKQTTLSSYLFETGREESRRWVSIQQIERHLGQDQYKFVYMFQLGEGVGKVSAAYNSEVNEELDPILTELFNAAAGSIDARSARFLSEMMVG